VKRLLLISIFVLLFSLQVFARWEKHVSPVTDDLHNIFFIGDKTGWIVSHQTGVILHTKDGGKTWKVLSNLEKGYIEAIYFLDSKTGWLAGERGFFYTKDGGKNWIKAEDTPGRDAVLYNIHFYNRQRGFTVGVDAKLRKPVFWETSDGGKNWKPRSETLPGFGYEPISFPNAKYGFAGGGRYILSTTDAGQSWQVFDVGSNVVIRGLYFNSPLLGWAVGHEGVVLQTTNGAKNWNQLPKFTQNRLRGVFFISNQHGFIVGDKNKEEGSLWESIDGGKIWKRVSDDYPDLHRIIVTSKHLWIVGKQGTILSRPRAGG
jgi:photosystem II stability/assembly factor-like uncharacterized protein